MLRARRANPVFRAGRHPLGVVSDYQEFKDGEIIAGTRYRVVRLVGVGGMGSVYEVEHVELGKRFVLKALLRQLARRHDLVLRLRNEWRALGRLEHPNIVTVTDAGTSAGGVPFYVMERLDGETLASRMKKTRRFVIPEALAIVARILQGLAAAHRIGVVHRDIKPPNIFLVGAEQPKILDFGVAKIADDPGVVTARGVAIGTPRYMSPEQARGEAVDSRSDIYSTGLILFEMITGVNPFEDARDSKELLVAHLTRSAPRPSSLAKSVPEELDAVLGQMLAKDAQERPSDAREVAEVLIRLRERWHELTQRDDGKESVSIMPLVSGSPNENDTTRPDGVASRGRGFEHSSAGRIAWTRDSGADRPTGSVAEPSRFEPTAATVRSLTGASGSLAPEQPSSVSSNGSSDTGRASSESLRTEMLIATPVPPTRTRAPITPSETPSSRKLSGTFNPSEDIIPDFRSRGRWVPWVGAGVLAAGVLAFVLVDLRQEPSESAQARKSESLAKTAALPPPPSAEAAPRWVAERSALQPAPSAEPQAVQDESPAPVDSSRPTRAERRKVKAARTPQSKAQAAARAPSAARGAEAQAGASNPGASSASPAAKRGPLPASGL